MHQQSSKYFILEKYFKKLLDERDDTWLLESSVNSCVRRFITFLHSFLVIFTPEIILNLFQICTSATTENGTRNFLFSLKQFC